MGVLLTMCCWDTDGKSGNNRSWMTKRTLQSLSRTVDLERHQLIVVDNGSDDTTKELLENFKKYIPMQVMTLSENIGTARGLNKAWEHRNGRHVLKIDNDVEHHDKGWLDRLEECIEREPRIGIIGCKRRDLDEWPSQPPGSKMKSRLVALPHEKGQTWLSVEVVNHCMGTCCLFNSALLDKIGFLYQFGVKHGFDDSLAAVRCHVAGFWNCFYIHYNIEHFDPGGDYYTQKKQDDASLNSAMHYKIENEYLKGIRPVYQGPNDE